MFCDQCGNQIPDGSVVCPVCGANLQQADEMKTVSFQAQPNMGFQAQPQPQPQPQMQAQPQPQMGGFQAQPQPQMGGFQGQPQMGGFQGQPMGGMPGYGAPQANPMANLFKEKKGEDFPMCKKSFLKTLLMKGKMMNFVGIICGAMIFICLFIPFVSYKQEMNGTKIRGSASMLISNMKVKAQGQVLTEQSFGYGGGWFVMIFTIAMITFYVLRFDVLAYIMTILNFAMLLSASGWFGGAIKGTDQLHFSAGFILFMIFELVALGAPFIWTPISKNMGKPKQPKMMGMPGQPMMGMPGQPMMGQMPPQQMGQMPQQQMGQMPPQQPMNYQ